MDTRVSVKLITSTPNPERVIAAAAKLCYSGSTVDELFERVDGEDNTKFIDHLARMGHHSPLEHISFTFAVEGVSRALTHQLVRHRIASYSQQSQRYVKLDQFEYIIPSAIENNPEAREVFVRSMERAQEEYDEIVDILFKEKCNKYAYSLSGFTVTDDEIEEMVSKKKSDFQKEAIENARYVFPNACESKIIITMNARTLLNFFSLRTCHRAQEEIRSMAIEILKICKKEAPALFSKAGPGCITGVCKEMKMSCGRMVEVNKFFKEL